ncbi:MAG: 6-carboxytetrahydropterin synthase [Myxococcales bacterium]|jgi:6-pyruvoyltetrahydropterin/6-carboxytetrahydropterin synthase|nr:6-carboxytetrahydropterin synthase [Myxococcales bacterium]
MGDYELCHIIRFESARRLTRVPEGHPCGRLYGLAFYLEIHVVGDLGPTTGWVVDFGDIEQAFAPLRADLDHNYLNDLEGLENPTSEVLVTWIWHRLKPRLPALSQLVLRENEVSKVIYRGPRAS